ncbi:OstA-like protein [Mucilaginibacter flavus]|nr:OstA-like protein [Mucilaginibacter flavus]
MTVAATVMGQKKSIVNLIQSEVSTVTKINGRDVIKVYKGVFKQDYSILRSDSAYFYPQDNAFDAFSNVNINQGDTLNIYSDKLNYNGNTKIAILTNNVRMIDRDAILTTNYLTYNTATRIGTYTGGGKLVNKDNVLVSKNGYYFAQSRDSYFRYDVVLTTVDAIIKTDTMKYNTGTRIAYFYGPTNIYGKKDKDTLYTENGLYNTVVEQAFFGKKNQYKQGTKSLKGDSLFYDKLKGYGRAVKNVTFADKEQKITMKGDLATYFRADERTVVTQNAYMVLVTEQKDTTQTDSVQPKPLPATTKAKSKEMQAPPNTMKITNMGNLAGQIKPTGMVSKKDSTRLDSVARKISLTDNMVTPGKIKSITDLANIASQVKPNLSKKDSAKSDSAVKSLSKQVKNMKPADAASKIGNLAQVAAAVKPGTKGSNNVKAPADTTKPAKMKRDSVFMTADTLETWITTYKDQKIYQEKQRQAYAYVRDTSAAARKQVLENKKNDKKLVAHSLVIPRDTSYRHPLFFGPPKKVPVDSAQIKKDKLSAIRKARQDSVRAEEYKRDPVFAQPVINLKDTARVRIVLAHHHAKIFKSDLQGKADSIFYSNSDSTIRCYVKPMFWTQGSQLSGDTIYVQMKNKKMDNMELFPSAFVVNIEKEDSLHFNQMGGKKMRGFFKNDKLDRLFTVGNAESIYFKRDSATNRVEGMQRSLSSRMVVSFKDSKLVKIRFLTKPENRYLPLKKVVEDDKILKGFIWKPKDRPVSKESIIPSHKKTSPIKAPAVKGKPGALPGKSNKGAVPDSLNKKLPLKMGKDSMLKVDTARHQGPKVGKDTVAKQPAQVKAVKDTTKQVVKKQDN